MSCAQAAVREPAAAPVLTLRSRPRRIALVGNANVGKSVLFGRLTGQYAVVSNYPGTTVVADEGPDDGGRRGVRTHRHARRRRRSKGRSREDELVARRILDAGDADVVIQVADARNLRRGLMLTSQLSAIGRPMVLVLNMTDEARVHGIVIDAAGLSARLGIPVVETVATEGRGVAELREAIGRAAVPARSMRPTAATTRALAHDLAVAATGATARGRPRASRNASGGWSASR